MYNFETQLSHRAIASPFTFKNLPKLQPKRHNSKVERQQTPFATQPRYFVCPLQRSVRLLTESTTQQPLEDSYLGEKLDRKL
ncbi:hypothetical protein [Anabaena sp. CCY 9402-a]|uniref:hypothetical protein n=1 Tax=Anabaena sp. CCY 9402-a TaxID=3103867 RepID=UPI0039C69378